jgi:DNA-binding NarL/FixJ family response regulator
MTTETYHILLAEPHDLLRGAVRTLLEAQPHLQVVGEAATGDDALCLALDARPHIAIVDYSLRGINGAELTRRLKEVVPHIRVLIYTMHNHDAMIVDVMDAGANGVVIKSDSEPDLLAAVDALLDDRPYFSGSVPKASRERPSATHL